MKYRLPLAVVISIFLLINVAFNINILEEILQFEQPETIQIGDGAVFEVHTEEIYQKLIKLENPFLIQKTFYPFETNIALNDSATSFALLFIPLRIIFNTHQSILIIIMVNIFLAELGMYKLLSKFNISPIISLVFSLVYGLTPFIGIRISGHYTYTSIYFFPWLFFVIIKFLDEKERLKKFVLLIIFSILLFLLLLTNFYFFIASIMLVVLYLLFFLWKDPKNVIKRIFLESPFILFSLSLFFLLIAPWLYVVQQYIYFDDLVKTPGFGGAIELSADLLSFITPSESNPFYRFIIINLSSSVPFLLKYKKFYISFGTHFAYPGIIILVIYIYLLIRWKKIAKSIKGQILPHVIISLFFAIILLGPFLKVANRWQFDLDGVRLVFPLPFLILHYIPVLNMMRETPRLLPVFVFLGCIVSSVIINKWLLKSNRKKIIIAGLVLVFFLDQFYYNSLEITQKIPRDVFNMIAKDRGDYSVLGIPFTLRDGFNYIGFVHDTMNLYGRLIHNHPVIGGYAARVSPRVFDYYKNLPFISYVANTVDKGNYNPYTQSPKNKKMLPFGGSTVDASNEIEFLNIRYVVLKNDESYSNQMAKFLQDIGFKKIFRDGQYDLLKITLKNKSYDQVNFGSQLNRLSVVAGLSEAINSKYRLVTDDVVKIFLKPKNGKILFFKAESDKSVKVDIYINKKFIDSKEIIPEKNMYSIATGNNIKKDNINEIILKFDKTAIVNGINVKLYSLGIK